MSDAPDFSVTPFVINPALTRGRSLATISAGTLEIRISVNPVAETMGNRIRQPNEHLFIEIGREIRHVNDEAYARHRDASNRLERSINRMLDRGGFVRIHNFRYDMMCDVIATSVAATKLDGSTYERQELVDAVGRGIKNFERQLQRRQLAVIRPRQSLRTQPVTTHSL